MSTVRSARRGAGLEQETKRLICGTLDWTGEQLKERGHWLSEFHWKGLGEDFLKKENITWILKK